MVEWLVGLVIASGGAYLTHGLDDPPLPWASTGATKLSL